MSAFIVDKEHIDALVTAAMSVDYDRHSSGLRWYSVDPVALRQASADGWRLDQYRREISYSDPERANEVGRMLWAENRRSIEYRYPDTAESGRDYPGPVDFDHESELTYEWKRTRRAEPVDVLCSIDCYEYQACEHPGWPASEAFQFCQALRHKMISALPGYSAAAWGAPKVAS